MNGRYLVGFRIGVIRAPVALAVALAFAAAVAPAALASDPVPTSWQPVASTVDGHLVGDPTPLAGRVSAIAAIPGSTPTEVVGTAGGIWKQTGAAAWVDVTGSGWPSTNIGSIAVDPVNSNILYAGTGSSDAMSGPGLGVLKSTDGGATWSPLTATESLMRGYAVTGLAVDPLNDQVVIAAAGNGLFRSSDSGTTWSKVVPIAGPAELRLSVDPITGDMLAGVAQSSGISAHMGSSTITTGHAVYRSTDGGLTWTAFALDTGTGGGFVVAPGIATSAGTTYAYALDVTGDSSNGLYTSADGGQTWQLRTAQNVTTKDNIAELVVDPQTPTQAYFAQQDGPFAYTWGSSTLSILTSGDGTRPQFGDWRALAIGPAAGSARALYGGTDGGPCFFNFSTQTYTNNSAGLVSGIDFFGSAKSSSTELTGTQDLGVDAYSGSGNGLELYHSDAYGVMIDQNNSSTYYAGTSDPGFVVSRNAGATWQPVALPAPAPSAPYYMRLVQAAGAPNVLLLPMSDSSGGTIYVSNNDGTSWTTRTVGLTGGDYLTSVRAALIPGTTVPVIYAGTGFGFVWRSADLGASWIELNPSNRFALSVRDIAIDAPHSTEPAGEHVFLALGVFAASWYAQATTVGDVLESVNSGTSWTDIGQALSATSVNALLLSGSTLLAGTDKGVDQYSGGVWSAGGTGFPNVRVNDLFLSQDGQAFFATTWGRGTLESAASVTAAPTITKVAPNTGSVVGGTTVTITGTGFAAGATVAFGSTAATSVTFVSATQLKVVAPAHAAGTVDVSVTTASGTSAHGVRDLFAYGAPTVTSFTPTSGITGSSVTITGTAFVTGVKVKFGSLAASAKVLSGTQLKVTVPSGAVPAAISVSDAQGTGSSSTQFTPTLSITSFSPSSGPAGTVVTINGVGFTSTSTVKFNGVAAASVTHVSSTQLQATVPASAATGTISVTNTTAPKGTVKSAAKFTVT